MTTASTKPAQSTGRLILVGTPIGNLGDMAPRGVTALQKADVLYCEDTRVTAKLCQHFSIRTPRRAYHEHNAQSAGDAILDALAQGQTIALVSDAGMPLISDPGYRLVQAVQEAGFDLEVIPGPTAVTTALVLSGLPSDRFLFAGFLPNKSKARQTAFAELASLKATLVFYEAPTRLIACLQDAQAVLGDRPAAVCRELTKLYEETQRGRLSEILQWAESQDRLRGEFVLLIGGAPTEEVEDFDLDTALRQAMARQSLKDAVEEVALISGLKKKAVYQRALALKTAP